MLNWKSETEFEVGGVDFVIDITPGPNRRISGTDSFTLVKTKGYIENYLGLCGERFENVLELGMFQGGSMVLFDKIFNPAVLVGVDITANEIKALEEYKSKQTNTIKTYYESSQDDEKLLTNIVNNDMKGSMDLVVDDASHLYELTKRSFEILFPLLKPGGMYIIEDWAWNFRENAQNNSHPWSSYPAMSNLIFEITAALASHQEIDEIIINNNMVKIRKSKNIHTNKAVSDLKLRGKPMGKI